MLVAQRAARLAEARPGSRWSPGRSTSPDDMARARRRASTEIYHLAGMVSHKAADAHRMYAVHVDGTRMVCEAAVRAGVRGS